MKHYIIIMVSMLHTLHAMEKTIQHTPREWDPESYVKGNNLQTTSFLNFLNTNNINIEQCEIISIGCGPGEIEAKLAQQAKLIHGIDASEKMINYAQKQYGNIKNLFFAHCFAEDFTSKQLYDYAIASFTLHWIENKAKAIQHISDCLKINGKFFANFQTSDNGEPLNLIILKQMFPTIQEIAKSNNNISMPPLIDENLQETIGVSYPSIQVYNTMLENAGFEIIKNEEQIYTSKMTKEELKNLQKPIILSRPCIQYLTEQQQEIFINTFVDEYIAQLEKTEDNTFEEKHRTTVLHARKIK